MAAGCTQEIPVVPLVSGKAPTLDGNIEPGEWRNAATLYTTDSERAPVAAPLLTRFSLQHDGTSLWVAVHCLEADAERPAAFVRSSEANLSIDDSVEVALGLAGGGERSLMMGGYDGAMSGATQRMEHLYQFVVNAAGSKARRYNEMALPHARFEAVTGRGQGFWQVEMRIPLASLGLKKAAGQELFANFVRYRPPSILAWRGMNFWRSYNPYPTAKLRLAASPQEKKTDEPLPAARRVANEEAGYQPSPLQYHPLSNTVSGVVPVPAGGRAVLQTVDIRREEVSPTGGNVLVALSLPQRLQPGQRREVELKVFNATRRLHFSQKLTAIGQAVPGWVGTKAAGEYRERRVPRPWTSPVVEGQTVRLAHADFEIGRNGLPQSIKTGAHEMLAAPLEIVLWSNGKTLPVVWETPRFETGHLRPVVYSRGRFGTDSVEVRTEIDYDGFLIVQVKFHGRPRQLDKVQVHCPLRAEFGRYFTGRGTQNTIALDEAGYKTADAGRHGGRYWLGSEKGGLTFSADLPFFKAAEEFGEVEVQVEKDVSSLILTPLDRASQLHQDTVLQFYLHPTPMRPQSAVTQDDYHIWWENWSDYQGYPDLSKLDQMKERVENDAKTGYALSHLTGKVLPGNIKKKPLQPEQTEFPFLPYFSQMLSEDAPGWLQYRDELIAPPERMWYKRSSGVGKGVPCYVACVRGPYGDLLLDGIQTLADKAGIGGVYMDGTTVSWDCDNPAHLACNEQRLPVWDNPGNTRILGTRSFLKRLRGIFDARDKPYYLVAHTGGGLDANTLSFVDQYWEGEQLARYLPHYRVPREIFATGYAGNPWGYSTLFFDGPFIGQRGHNWSLSYALLFNTDNNKYSVRQYLRPFEMKDSRFHPYWEDGQKLLQKSRIGRTNVSYYTTQQQVMVIAHNFSFEADEIEIDLSSFGGVEWIDLLARKGYVVANGVAKVTLPPQQGIALRPQSQVMLKPLAQSGGQNTVPFSIRSVSEWKLGDETIKTDSWLKLKSTGENAPAFATLQSEPLQHNVALHLKLKAAPDAIWQIDVGPVSLIRQGGWQIREPRYGWNDARKTGELGANHHSFLPIDGWNDNGIRQVPLDEKAETDLQIELYDHVLSVYVNGQAVVDKMALRRDLTAGRPLRLWSAPGRELAFRLVKLESGLTSGANDEVSHPVAP